MSETPSTIRPVRRDRPHRTLTTDYPDVAAQWHPTLNNSVLPSEISPGSHRKVWWRCAGGHDFAAIVAKRTGRSQGCPICSGRVVDPGVNDLETMFPGLAAEWDEDRNGRSAAQVKAGSNQKAWWVCARAGHTFQACVYHRTGRAKSGCPYCSGRVASQGTNDLATIRPDLLSEWDFDRNRFKPDECAIYSNRRAWWRCKTYGHEWCAMISSRTAAHTGCPYCAGRRVSIGFNDLATLRPDLATEWHLARNDCNPTDVTVGSNRKIWWKCEEYAHEWVASVADRVRGYGCLVCSGRIVVRGFNDLESSYPSLAAEWDRERNGFAATEITCGSNRRVWWTCANRHSFETSVAMRTARGRGCPYCANKRVLVGFNDLQTTHPDIAVDWDYERNGHLLPTGVIGGSHQAVFWHCRVYRHSYKASIIGRISGGGCAICSGKVVLAGFNDLETRFPHVASEWHPTRNGMKSCEVMAFSGYRAWWRCRDGHEWQAVVASRAAGRACGACIEHGTSKRERAVCSRIAEQLGAEYRGPERVDGWQREVDLALRELGIIVEYDGYFWHRDKVARDNRKTKALEAQGWKVVRVRERRLPVLNGLTVECTDNEDPADLARRVAEVILRCAESSPRMLP